ncbi:MAG TPA: YsnF/AvaK domain-containing protein [Pyrinomonadaceae bacterium]
MIHTVVGLFDNRSNAGAATQELIQKGFLRENIDVSNRQISDAATSTQIAVTETGVSESIGNFFNSLFGGDKKTARNYTTAAGDADAIITVQVDSLERAREAAEILDRHGAIDVDGRSSQHEQNLQQNQQILTAAPNAPQTAQNAADIHNAANIQNETAIPVIEEQLQVGKQIVQREGARVRSRIVEKPVEANLRLREEHIVVNRRSVNRDVTNADLANFREGELVITEHAEIPVVGKQARVVEEILIGKNVTEHVETVHGTIRRNEVEVEKVNTDVTDADDINTRGATT